MSKGKREAAGGGWHTGGDPFGEGNSRGKRQKTGGKNIKRMAWIVLGCVAALVLLAAAAIKLFVVPPDVSDKKDPGVKDVWRVCGDGDR